MRVVKLLALGLALCVGVVLLPWILTFAGSLSPETADWAEFGDYFGGTFASLVAALALVALLYTISQQNEQIRILRNQASKEDILHTIDRLERDFEKALEGAQVTVQYPSGDHTVSARDVLFKITFVEYKAAIPTQSEIFELAKSSPGLEVTDPRFLIYEVFGAAAGELNQIRLYAEGLGELESITGNNLLFRYYARKYAIPYARFLECGFLTTKWSEKT